MKRLSIKTSASLVAIFSAFAAPAFAQDATATAPTTDASNALADTATPQQTLPPQDPTPALPPPSHHHHHFDLGQFIDDVTIAPLAHLYGALPHQIRNGVHNILSNLNEPDVAVNDLLQLHPGQAAKAAFRFAANTTVGVAGIFDVAKHLGARHHDNDAATTLAYYRVGDGPNFHVPIIETDNAREAAGFAIDFVIDPVGWGQFKNADTVYASQMAMEAIDDHDQEAPSTEMASIEGEKPASDASGAADATMAPAAAAR